MVWLTQYIILFINYASIKKKINKAKSKFMRITLIDLDQFLPQHILHEWLDVSCFIFLSLSSLICSRGNSCVQGLCRIQWDCLVWSRSLGGQRAAVRAQGWLWSLTQREPCPCLLGSLRVLSFPRLVGFLAPSRDASQPGVVSKRCLAEGKKLKDNFQEKVNSWLS